MGMKALLVSILFLASLMPVSARAQLCQGLEITIEGSDAAEVLTGTDGPDVIAGFGGDDVINGLDGADVICGGDGDDDINGGREQLTATGAIRPIEAFLVSGDQIDGGPGQDVCRGDVGVDFSQNCEASRDMELDFRFLTLSAEDGTPLDGALFVPAGETRRVAMLASHGSLGRFSTVGLAGGSGPYGELIRMTVLTLNRRDNGIDNGGPLVEFEDAVDDMKVGVDFLAGLGYEHIFVAGHSKGTVNAAAYLNLIDDQRVVAIGLYSAVDDLRFPPDSDAVITAQALVDQGLGDVPADINPSPFGSNPWTPSGLLSFHGPNARTAAFLEVRELGVPLLILRAFGDSVTTDEMSRRILDSALAAGVDATYIVLPFTGSGGAAHGFVGVMREVMSETLNWLLTAVPESGDMIDAPVVPPQTESGNFLPVARVVPIQAAVAGARVQLDGSASVDLDGDIVSWQWRQLSGPDVALGGSATPIADFVMPEGSALELSFELVVLDDEGAPAAATTQAVGAEIRIDNSGGGFPGLLVLILLWPMFSNPRRR